MARICLLVDDDANRRVLGEWLRGDRDDVVVETPPEGGPESDEPGDADVFVADAAGLRVHEALVTDRKDAAGTVFVPCLLASERGEAALHGVEAGLVDDVVELPASKTALGRRLDRLLHERDQSRSLAADRASLREQNERLRMFAARLAHDLRNPLGIATGYLEQVRADPQGGHIDVVEDALDRIQRLIDETLMLAKMGQTALDRDPVSMAAVARQAWRHVETGDGRLSVVDDATVQADDSRLQELLENLFRNAVEHGSTSPRQAEDAAEHGSTSPRSQAREDAAEHVGGDVEVRVGALADGFYVADDGPGISAHDREQVFEVGYTTNEDGTGFGLRIVQEIAEAHGWSVAVTDSDDGGARFEIRGVDLDPAAA